MTEYAESLTEPKTIVDLLTPGIITIEEATQLESQFRPSGNDELDAFRGEKGVYLSARSGLDTLPQLIPDLRAAALRYDAGEPDISIGISDRGFYWVTYNTLESDDYRLAFIMGAFSIEPLKPREILPLRAAIGTFTDRPMKIHRLPDYVNGITTIGFFESSYSE